MCSWVCVCVPARGSFFVCANAAKWVLAFKHQMFLAWKSVGRFLFSFFFADTVPVNGVLLLTAHLNGFLVFCSRIYNWEQRILWKRMGVCVCVRKCICMHLDRATNVAASLLFWSFVVMCQPRNRVPQQQLQ